MAIPGIVRLLLDFLVVTTIILFIPGVPPRVNFETYTITAPLQLNGALSPNSKLDSAQFLYENKLKGPESIVTKNGDIYTGTIGGDVIKIEKTGDISVVAHFGEACDAKWQESVCGRPLGIRFDPNGKLIVNDAYNGIFRVDVHSGDVEQLVSTKLTNTVDGRPLMLVNDLDIATDGTIYFSDSSQFALQSSALEFLGEATGRVLKLDPITLELTVLVKGVQFSNGVQLSKDESFLLISETAGYRILKYNIKGPNKGKSEVFIDGLPGAPDNIRSDGKDGFLLSLVMQRSLEHPLPNERLANFPLVRKFISRIFCILEGTLSFIHSFYPNEYTGVAKYYINHLEPGAIIHSLPGSIILQVANNGEILSSMHSSNGHVKFISETTIDENGEYAYLGSPYNDGLWRIKVKDLELK